MIYEYHDLLIFINRISKYIIIAQIAPLYIYSYFCLSIFILKGLLYYSFYLHLIDYCDYSVVVLLSDFLYLCLFVCLFVIYF